MNTFRLLVEGRDDKHVVEHLLCNHGFDNIDCREKDGIDGLLKQMQLQIEEATDWDRLGVIIDADVDLQKQWSRIVGVLARNEFNNLPAAPDVNGTVISVLDDKRIGIWVMPDNSLQGSIEDFLRKLIPADDSLWPRANNAVEEIPGQERRFKPTYISKAKIHTWLAWQEDPGTRMGSALTKKYFDAGLPQAQAFVDWVHRLLS
jgi:hypothetical protein